MSLTKVDLPLFMIVLVGSAWTAHAARPLVGPQIGTNTAAQRLRTYQQQRVPYLIIAHCTLLADTDHPLPGPCAAEIPFKLNPAGPMSAGNTLTLGGTSSGANPSPTPEAVTTRTDAQGNFRFPAVNDQAYRLDCLDPRYEVAVPADGKVLGGDVLDLRIRAKDRR